MTVAGNTQASVKQIPCQANVVGIGSPDKRRDTDLTDPPIFEIEIPDMQLQIEIPKTPTSIGIQLIILLI